MQLIISEKPSAAKRLASALADSPIQTKKLGKAAYYEIVHDMKPIIIAPAVGHLFGLAPKKRTRNYPFFDVEWVPASASYALAYIKNLLKVAKKADEFIVATDYDIEGEVIGLNIVRFICNQKDAQRMKFSTLTTPDLQRAYETRSKTLDWGQARAGETRHHLDWFYGINLSKAASAAILGAMQRYQTISIGRVQGPTLAILAERELEIQAFNPVPYWQIFIKPKIKGETFQAVHIENQFFDELKAKQIFEKIKDQPATVKSLEKKQYQQLPPTPFDLTTLQTEAFRCFKISPKMTLAIAQELYTAALISYPRTSSQKLPPTIGYKTILTKLAKQSFFAELISKLPKLLQPRQGAKSDPAHPAIFPTGEFPKGLNKQQLAIYQLIVKRFIACFGETALKEITTIIFDVKEEDFLLKGARTLKQGWKELYAPFSKEKELELPELKKGEVYQQKSKLDQKETEPPARYSQASIIKKLEAENLGTKATRASILDILYQRGYVQGQPIEVTKLGLQVVDTFSKFAPEILSRELTSKFELGMEKIREGKIKPADVLDEAKKVIIKICAEFDKNIIPIGESLAKAFTETQKEQGIVCDCPNCKAGKMRVIYSKKTGKRFLACNKYPECKTTWGLPQKGKLYVLKLKCKCGTPKVRIYLGGSRKWDLCVNPECSEKKEKTL